MTTYEYLISNSSPVPAEKPQPVELKLPADLKQDLLWGDTSLGQSSVLQRVNGESDAKNPCMWEFSFLTTVKSLQYEMLNRET